MTSEKNPPIASFVVPGTPVPKARPRVSQDRRGRNRTFTPDATVNAEAQVIRHYVESGARRQFDKTARFRLDVDFHGAHGSADVDNLMKLVLDGLNEYAWPDDKQVTEVHARKLPAPKTQARTVVRINVLT